MTVQESIKLSFRDQKFVIDTSYNIKLLYYFCEIYIMTAKKADKIGHHLSINRELIST